MLLPRWRWAATSPEPGHPADPNWLVQYISKKACELFQHSRRCEDLQAAGAQAVRRLRRHKKPVATLGEDTFCLPQCGSDRPAFCIDVVHRDAGGDGAGDGDAIAAGSGPKEREWSHAYVAMGLPYSHPLQAALLARVYNLDLAVCFVRAIVQVLRVPVREGAIWAPEGDAGLELHKKFRSDLEAHGVPVAPALDGRALSSLTCAEVANAAQAATLAECEAFLFFVLGPDNLRLIRAVLE